MIIVDKDSVNPSGQTCESLDVNQLKDELDVLEKERATSEKNRITVDKELTNAANNTKKIEEVRSNIGHTDVLANCTATRSMIGSRGRGSRPAGRRRSCSNRGSVALCTLGLGLLNRPSFRGS